MLTALVLSAAMVVAPTLQSPTLAAVERETTALFDHVAPTVVLIETADGFGSGFFVSPLGHILTNRHVVGTQGTVRVRLHDGRRVTGTVVERGAKGVDLALVKVAVKGAPALPLAPTRSLRIGTWAGSVGHGRGGVWTLTTGLISNAHGGRARGVLQTQIPLNPGASGGPVFDRRGRVVGVVASGLVDSDAVNFAITAETALASLPALRPVTNCLSVGAPKGASVFVNGTRIGAGPLVTLVAEPGTYEIEVDVAGTRRKESVTFPERRTVTFRAR